MGKVENSKLKIFKLHKEGKNNEEIAELVGCSKDSIYRFLLRHNRIKKIRKESTDVIKIPRKRKESSESKSEIKLRFMREYLRGHPCIDCGNSDVRVLEFDHVRGKKIDRVSKMARDASSISQFLEEIDKCEIRCANCHRIVTIERRIKPI